MSMFSDAKSVICFSFLIIVIFISSLLVSLSFFGVQDAYAASLVAKVISLLLLVAFGQSEALNYYIIDGSTRKLKIFVKVNQFGILIGILISLLLIWKTYEIISGIQYQGEHYLSYIWILFKNNSECLSFLPILYFAILNIFIWVFIDTDKCIGRVCFIVSDLPIVVPIGAVLCLTSIFNIFSQAESKLLVSGATVMFILVSIVLNECTKSLLKQI